MAAAYFRSALISALFLVLHLSQGQGPSIDFYVDNFDEDFLVLADYGGEQLLVEDTLHKIAEGHYQLREHELADGPYILASLAQRKYFDYILDTLDTSVEIRADWNNLPSRKIVGSPQNQAFLDYVAVLDRDNREIQKINELISAQGEDSPVALTSESKIKKIKEEQDRYASQMIEQWDGKYLATVVRSQKPIEYPEQEGLSEDEQIIFNYSHRLKHYFDHVKDEPRYFRSRYFKNMVKKYVKEYTVSNPDSVFKSMKYVLDMVESEKDVFHHYLVSWINEYTQSNRMNDERVWVYLTQEYIEPNRAEEIISEEQYAQMVKKANVHANSFNGVTGKDLRMPTLDLEETIALDLEADPEKYYVLSDTKSLYERTDSITVLFFWKASCGHCQTAFPVLVDLQRKYGELGLGVFAINVGSYKKYKEAAKFIVENQGQDIDHFVDPHYSSKYAEKYAVSQTPGIFILDRDKKILFNRMGASQLEQFVKNAMEAQGINVE